MQKFKTLKPISLHSGEVGLTDKQYDRREATRALEKTGKAGVFKILKAICLKAGETFFYSGDEGKKLAHSIELIEEKKPAVRKTKPVKK